MTIRWLEIPNLTAEGGQERHDIAGSELWLLGGANWPGPWAIGCQQRMLYMRSA